MTAKQLSLQLSDTPADCPVPEFACRERKAKSGSRMIPLYIMFYLARLRRRSNLLQNSQHPAWPKARVSHCMLITGFGITADLKLYGERRTSGRRECPQIGWGQRAKRRLAERERRQGKRGINNFEAM